MNSEFASLESSQEFPVASIKDFDNEVPEDERLFCLQRYTDLNKVKQARMHCTGCNKHLGLTSHNLNKLRMHPLLRTLVCVDCLEFYNSGEFVKGEDGSELYCRWCGQGGQVYCCATCPIVFCENCIKRNFGQNKIDEIESIDDWNCFICAPKVIWCHRAALWAARRYCMLKNKLTLTITDPLKRLKLQRECQIDESICCKRKKIINKPIVEVRKAFMDKKISSEPKKLSISDAKKAVKRMGSPLTIKKYPPHPTRQLLANLPSTLSVTPPTKKFNQSFKPTPIGTLGTPVKFPPGLSIGRPEKTKKSIPQNSLQNLNLNPGFSYNGFISNFGDPYINTDNVNLSLESLTQGLDVSNLSNMSQNDFQSDEDNVICTPDLPMPLEPVCEVTEADEECSEIPLKNFDDDVQCLTPAPKIIPKPISALTDPKLNLKQYDFNPNFIVQMSEKDVTINKETGGLKFRVDPASLSTSKMYQLPDGRVFAVNLNSKMPGGYSATIVSMNDSSASVLSRPGLTIRPPLQRNQDPQENSSPIIRSRLNANKPLHSWTTPVVQSTRKSFKLSSVNNNTSSKTEDKNKRFLHRKIKDHTVPKIYTVPRNKESSVGSVEWYTYNLYDAIYLVDYVSRKLHKIKNTQTNNIRNKSIKEMKDMHYTFEQLLKVSCQRFTDIKNSLNQEFKNWLKDKSSIEIFSDDDEESEKIEICAEIEEPKIDESQLQSDEPIFIDENSSDSVKQVIFSQSSGHFNTHSNNGMPIIENVMCEINDEPKDNTYDTDNDCNNEKNEKLNYNSSKHNDPLEDPLRNIDRSQISIKSTRVPKPLVENDESDSIEPSMNQEKNNGEIKIVQTESLVNLNNQNYICENSNNSVANENEILPELSPKNDKINKDEVNVNADDSSDKHKNEDDLEKTTKEITNGDVNTSIDNVEDSSKVKSFQQNDKVEEKQEESNDLCEKSVTNCDKINDSEKDVNEESETKCDPLPMDNNKLCERQQEQNYMDVDIDIPLKLNDGE